jgi:hypothetical protein
MAGQAQRGSRARGRSTRRGASSDPRSAAFPAPSQALVPSAVTALVPTSAPGRGADPLVTRSTYRLLQMRGLAPAEAANLTAYLCGIPVAEADWSLRQVNQLLFLRQLALTGRFGAHDGAQPGPN